MHLQTSPSRNLRRALAGSPGGVLAVFLSLRQKSLRASFRQGFWFGIQALRFVDPGWKHAGVTEFETFAGGYNETFRSFQSSSLGT